MSQPFEISRDGFLISTDPNLLDMITVHEFLARAYWAKNRPRQRTEEAFSHSMVFGLYKEKRLIGMARIVTDHSIFAYLCDVFIHEDFRGIGLGKWLLQNIFDHPDLISVRRWLLATDDAHGLYQSYDFEQLPEPEKWMQRLRRFRGES